MQARLRHAAPAVHRLAKCSTVPAVRRTAITALLLLLVLPGLAQAQEPAPVKPGPVIPAGVEGKLKAALSGSPLPGDLTFQAAQIAKDHVVVTYASAASKLAVTLKHPSVSEGAAASVAAFTIHATPGPADPAAVAELAKRLQGLPVERFWMTPTQAGGDKPAEAAPDKARPTRNEDDPRIRKALHFKVIGEPSRGLALLEEVDTDGKGGLALADAWWQLGEGPKGQKVAAAWSAANPSADIPSQLRSKVLAGDPLTPAEALKQLGPKPEACAGRGVAEALRSVGRSDDAYVVLRDLGAEPKPCLKALAEEIGWMTDDIEVALARDPKKLDAWKPVDALSAKAYAAYGDNEDIASKRARVLLGMKDPLGSADVLEKIAEANPRGGLVSAYLGAMNRVQDVEWKVAKLRHFTERAKANPKDHFAGFLAGVLLHYDGDFEESNALLEPLVSTEYASEPRLFIYLGMNHFDLYPQDPGPALAHIATAASLRTPDPDVYYCRAEIQRLHDPPDALVNLDRYLAQTKTSTTANPRKKARVQRMRDTLAVCIAKGQKERCEGPWEHPRKKGVPLYEQKLAEGAGDDEASADGPPWPFIGGGAALLLLGAGFLVSRRRRQSR